MYEFEDFIWYPSKFRGEYVQSDMVEGWVEVAPEPEVVSEVRRAALHRARTAEFEAWARIALQKG